MYEEVKGDTGACPVRERTEPSREPALLGVLPAMDPPDDEGIRRLAGTISALWNPLTSSSAGTGVLEALFGLVDADSINHQAKQHLSPLSIAGLTCPS